MKTSTLHIRNMCCGRCIEAVTDELQSLGLKIGSVKLGVASYVPSDKIKLSQIESVLSKRGFVLIQDEEEILIEKIKAAIFDLVHRLTEAEKTKFSISSYLEERINVSYRTLSRIFSQRKHLTIEKYFILLKVEKIKDLIQNSNVQFSEIAFSMGYKSLSHLSAQFRQVTGITMQEFKKTDKKNRKLIDTI